MLVFNVGKDDMDFSEYEEDFEWIVYDYEQSGWNGLGEMVGLSKDKKLYHACLGHCSCYIERELEFITIEEFLREKDNIHDLDFCDEVKNKVKELLTSLLV